MAHVHGHLQRCHRCHHQAPVARACLLRDTRFLAPLGVTPNMVTTIAALMTVLAFWFFLKGQFIPGLIAAWAMTFLDTVDGKLARTTLTSSKWGDYFDHGIDLIHPPFWYVAWGYGLHGHRNPMEQ